MNKRETIPLLLASLCFVACATQRGVRVDLGDTGKTKPIGTDETDTASGDVPAPGAYSVTIDGSAVPVTRLSEFEVPVNYVHLTYPGSAIDIGITPDKPSGDFTLSPKSRKIDVRTAGDTLSFTVDEPAYLVLQIPGQERLFLLIDPEEVDAPAPGDANVKNVLDYDAVDNAGPIDPDDVDRIQENTDAIQAAIDNASGAKQNILYFPEGVYSTYALYLRDDMTLYLAKGATLKNATKSALGTPDEVTSTIELSCRGYIVMNGVRNARLMGRGIIDGNNAVLRNTGGKMFSVKIEHSKDCVVDGVISQDSHFWNTLAYRSDNITISNYKVINNRPKDDTDESWNETDGVDFDNCTHSSLYNAFLYTGDDCMAVKSDDIPDEMNNSSDPTSGEYINVQDISHEKVVCYSGSSACKVGTKTFGDSMSGIAFKEIDVLTARRALVIDAVDTASITGTEFEDIRIEAIDRGRIIDLNMDVESIFWRKNMQGTCTVTDTTISRVYSDVNAENRILGRPSGASDEDTDLGPVHCIDNITFSDFRIEGNRITSIDDPRAIFNIDGCVKEDTLYF
jgi:hypothetical protein